MKRTIEIIFDDHSTKKQTFDNNELTDFYNELSIFIGFKYLNRTILQIIKKHYFYLSENEQHFLMDRTISTFNICNVSDHIFDKLYEWFSNNDKLNIEAFFIFRLKEYRDYIEVLIQSCMEKLLAELEHEHIIDYFKSILHDQISYIDTVYVYAGGGNFNIFNEAHKRLAVVNNCDELFLNIMMSIAPQNIYFYGVCSENFFNTLKDIFGNRLKTMRMGECLDIINNDPGSI